ncbi:oxidoreductase [Roseibium sediminis]|uniref:oxidoreductase n=1 Tax=Roseibium sediminis TaxID=1775174 RepID=UPI00123D22FC|nr:oxidoreductase [Roseibium sediminis]
MGGLAKTVFALFVCLLMAGGGAFAQGSTILSVFRDCDGPQPHEFNRSGLSSLDQVTIETSTPWISGRTRFEGPLLLDVLDLTGGCGEELEVIALNGFRARIPVSDIHNYKPILALKENGRFMKVRNRGPLFIVFPFDDYPSINNEIYFSRSVWQVREIHVH